MFHSPSPILFAETNKGFCRFRYVGKGKFNVTLMKGPNQRRVINRNTEHFYEDCQDHVLVEACKKELDRFHSDDHEIVLCGNQLIGFPQHSKSNYVRARMLQFAHNVVDDLNDVAVRSEWFTDVTCSLFKLTNDLCEEHGISKDKAEIQSQLAECNNIIRRGVGL